MVVSVVHVLEDLAPDGVEPVEWHLVTNLPVATEDQILFVVDCYRHRWLMDEYHKAVKTGASYESRQGPTFDDSMEMLVITIPVAVQMLRFRWFDRFNGDADALEVLTEDQIAVLRMIKQPHNRTLSKTPTVKEALVVAAQLGGHCRYGGAAGWLVLYRGLSRLSLRALGYRTYMDEAMRQSREGSAKAT